jgi:pantetheine-phosphate adenylyltransferase
MATYFLPTKLKRELRKIWGIPIFGPEKQVVIKFKEFCQKRKFKKIITVGDYCSLNLPSDVKIFDGRIKRKKIKIPLEFSFSCTNPPGTIQEEVWPVLKTAIKGSKNVFIEGEEDLLVIPSVLLAEKNTAVVYGFPEKGVCLIEVTLKTKENFKRLLKKFRKGKFKKILLGGTFNSLHPGHQYFLSMAQYYGKEAIIGLCSDQMVKARKKHFKEVRKFGERKKALENYLKKIGWKAKIVKINDIYGPAAKNREVEAILLTEETFSNGVKINRRRKKNNLKELHYIVLPYLLDKTGRKLNSSSKYE